MVGKGKEQFGILPCTKGERSVRLLSGKTENICFFLSDLFSNGCLAQRSGALKQELGTCGDEAFGGTQ